MQGKRLPAIWQPWRRSRRQSRRKGNRYLPMRCAPSSTQEPRIGFWLVVLQPEMHSCEATSWACSRTGAHLRLQTSYNETVLSAIGRNTGWRSRNSNMSTERQHQYRAHKLPSERMPPRQPAPGTKDADFLARLNEVFENEPDLDDEQLITSARSAFMRTFKNAR
jgi:hypothetical protein